MTALAGHWSFDGAPTAESCQLMLDAQRDRGPHHQVRNDEPPISLGRNLFRILPEDRFDSGPIVGAGGRLRLIADIRLDNREELGRALGRGLAELSDSAVAMLAFERWGEEAVERLYGDFALALWNGVERRLLLARDFAGQRPLHYHRGGDFFAFASTARGLHALPAIARTPDLQAFADFLALLPESGKRSYFEGIDKVPAGHVVVVTEDGFECRSWWRPSLAPISASPETHIEALRTALDRAVEVRLRGAEGAVATHLSGGLDSAAVTATAARLMERRGERVAAYTAVPREGFAGAVFGDGFADEGPRAAETARLHANIDHRLVAGAERSPLDHFQHDLRFYERPMLNVANMSWVEAIHDDARARDLKVLLTGISGNLTLSYDGLHALPELLASGRLARLIRLARPLHGNGSRWGTLASRTLGPFLPRPLWRRLRRGRAGLGEAEAGPLLREPYLGAVRRRSIELGADPDGRPDRDGREARIRALRGSDPAHYVAGALAGWGLDVRDPTADRALVELCLRIPAQAWLVGGRPRGLARAALADRLPESVVDDRRKGLQAADWHEPFGRAAVRMEKEIELIAACPEAAALLDTDRMSEWLSAWPAADPGSRRAYHLYRQSLLRAIAAGHFIRKAAA